MTGLAVQSLKCIKFILQQEKNSMFNECLYIFYIYIQYKSCPLSKANKLFLKIVSDCGLSRLSESSKWKDTGDWAHCWQQEATWLMHSFSLPVSLSLFLILFLPLLSLFFSSHEEKTGGRHRKERFLQPCIEQRAFIMTQMHCFWQVWFLLPLWIDSSLLSFSQYTTKGSALITRYSGYILWYRESCTVHAPCLFSHV